MIIASITALLLFFGIAQNADRGRAVDRLAARTSEHITDDHRARQVKTVIGEMRTELERFDRERARLVRELLVLDRNYNADAAEYRRVTRELNALWQNTENTLVDLRFEMRNSMTRDEWKAVFKDAPGSLLKATAE